MIYVFLPFRADSRRARKPTKVNLTLCRSLGLFLTKSPSYFLPFLFWFPSQEVRRSTRLRGSQARFVCHWTVRLGEATACWLLGTVKTRELSNTLGAVRSWLPARFGLPHPPFSEPGIQALPLLRVLPSLAENIGDKPHCKGVKRSRIGVSGVMNPFLPKKLSLGIKA